jgi:two-component system, cell cycle response regulator
VSRLVPETEALFAIVTATIDAGGILLEANAGFLRLVSPRSIDERVSQCFIQPEFITLMRAKADAARQVHQGLLTIGDRLGRARSLQGRVWRENERLRVLAEYDIAELEQLYDTVLALNREYANAQIELAQINRKLQQREAQILAASLTDPLTGIGNRRRLEQALATEISRAARTGESLCAFMADLDHFKPVNDRLGHEVGDQANILRGAVRPTDLVARLGGDEFALWMNGADHMTAAERAEFLCVEVPNELREITCDGGSTPTVSIGIATREAGSREPVDNLLRRADQAMYEVKRTGRGHWHVAAEGQV